MVKDPLDLEIYFHDYVVDLKHKGNMIGCFTVQGWTIRQLIEFAKSCCEERPAVG